MQRIFEPLGCEAQGGRDRRKRTGNQALPFMQGGGTMKVNKIDHICIAVKNLDEARKRWEPIMGKDKPDDEYIDEPEKIRVARYWVLSE